MKDQFQTVPMTLEEIADEDPRAESDAENLLKVVANFEFYFYVAVLDVPLASCLQAEKVDLS